MNEKCQIGQLRPSQILFTYGIGAVADLLNLSVMIMGLNEWDSTYTKELNEERLLIEVRRVLGKPVERLLSPPVCQDDEQSPVGIPVVPFPSWMVCPQCRLLAPLQSGLFQVKIDRYRPEKTRYVHQNCNKSKKPPTVIPVRFLVACEEGHLDEFPWLYFVHRGNTDCHGPLRLEEQGVSGSTTDIFVKCDRCDVAPRQLSEAFGESGKQHLPQCRGRHPHLREFDEQCEQQMRAILLGASNIWFPVTLSALSLPAGDTEIKRIIEENWQRLQRAKNPEILETLLATFQSMGELQDLASYSLEEIWKVVEAKRDGVKVEETKQDLKTPEWLAFSQPDPLKNMSEFQLNPLAPPEGFADYFTQTVLVERLKEVRALIGFTRIQSSGDFIEGNQLLQEYLVRISRQTPTWVPSSEVRGEGIFLQFNENRLREWENQDSVYIRTRFGQEAYKNWLNSRGVDLKKAPKFPGMRYILLHSFAHALMRQLAIACGYNAASLRERIYSQLPQAENGPQAGVLIYTAAADSEGTLGGLVHLGQPQILGKYIAGALSTMSLCASDPLCAEHDPSDGSISLHWAACHACLFSPETSCERGNKFLDRSVLIPTVSNPDLAFFK